MTTIQPIRDNIDWRQQVIVGAHNLNQIIQKSRRRLRRIGGSSKKSKFSDYGTTTRPE